MEKEYYTINEAVRLTGYSVSWFRFYLFNKTIIPIRKEGYYRVFISRNTVQSILDGSWWEKNNLGTPRKSNEE